MLKTQLSNFIPALELVDFIQEKCRCKINDPTLKYRLQQMVTRRIVMVLWPGDRDCVIRACVRGCLGNPISGPGLSGCTQRWEIERRAMSAPGGAVISDMSSLYYKTEYKLAEHSEHLLSWRLFIIIAHCSRNCVNIDVTSSPALLRVRLHHFPLKLFHWFTHNIDEHDPNMS